MNYANSELRTLRSLGPGIFTGHSISAFQSNGFLHELYSEEYAKGTVVLQKMKDISKYLWYIKDDLPFRRG